MMDSNGQFSDIGCLPAKSLPQLRRNAALAMAALAKGGCVRKTAIHAQFNQWLQSICHSDILTTSRYINVNSKKLSEAAQRFKHWPLHKAA